MSRSIRAALEACLLAIAFAVALLMAPAYGRTVVGIAPVAAALLIAALSLLYGRALGRLLRLPPAASHRNAFELVAGFGGVSLVHLTATAVLNLTALAALPVDLVCGAALFAGTVVPRPFGSDATCGATLRGDRDRRVRDSRVRSSGRVLDA